MPGAARLPGARGPAPASSASVACALGCKHGWRSSRAGGEAIGSQRFRHETTGRARRSPAFRAPRPPPAHFGRRRSGVLPPAAPGRRPKGLAGARAACPTREKVAKTAAVPGIGFSAGLAGGSAAWRTACPVAKSSAGSAAAPAAPASAAKSAIRPLGERALDLGACRIDNRPCACGPSALNCRAYESQSVMRPRFSARVLLCGAQS